MRGSHNQVDIAADVDDVYAVLADPTSYPDWLVGAKGIRSVDGDWPRAGSCFRHRIGVGGPLTVPGSTTVRRAEPPRLLELGAGMGPFGEFTVRFVLTPTADGTHLEIEEEPRRGAARHAWTLLRPLVLVGLWGRNEVSLASLRDAVETRHPHRREDG